MPRAAHIVMTNKAVPLGSIVCADELEEEQTRIFSRVFLDYAAQQSKAPQHRYVAIAIPALLEEETVDSPSNWLRATTALLWGCGISIIGAAAFVALSG